MTIKCLNSGSDGNCYILTSDSGKHLILDAGIPIGDIKKGLNFDIENIEACLITHIHNDHSKSAEELKTMGFKVWQPYLDTKHPRMRTRFGEFEVECLDVPHNGCENRAFLIKVNNTVILYATDYEYIGYDLSEKGINVALVELNYQSERIINMDEHRRHTVLGHASETTVIDFLSTIKRDLRIVILCHMSKSGMLDRASALDNIRAVIPKYINVEWAKPGQVYNIDEIPF